MKKNIYFLKIFCLICSIAWATTICCSHTKYAGSAETGSTDNPIKPYIQNVTQCIPGNKYYWQETDGYNYPNDVNYIAGNMPLIISVPHGGSLLPDDIQDRTVSCSMFYITLDTDDYIIEMANLLMEKIVAKTNGNFPHVIINNLNRIKIDQNRGWGEECNPMEGRGEKAWTNFHTNFIQNVAVKKVLSDYGKGLYIDLHGMINFYGDAVHAGYNIITSELGISDDALNNPAQIYIDKSSIRFLYKNLKARGIVEKFTDLLRGKASGHESFGDIFEPGLVEMNKTWFRGYHISPRSDFPVPAQYYAGDAYNTQAINGTKEGTKYDYTGDYTEDNFISGFQLEINYEIRLNTSIRADFAERLADAILKYMENNFN